MSTETSTDALKTAGQADGDNVAEGDNFAENALRMSGKSAQEVASTGAIDRADDHVDKLFAPRYQTTASPIHQGLWADRVDWSLFQPRPTEPSPEAKKAVDDSLNVVRRHLDAGTSHDDNNKISAELLSDLGGVGYWGLLVDPQFGGLGTPFSAFAPMITKLATLEPTVAMLASIHGCVGAVDPVEAFGNDEQKQRLLPELATGKRLSAFALTEPGSGSDLTALTTHAQLDGDHYILNGEKLFITNATYGRTVGVVCKIDGKSQVLLVDLPPQDTEHFQLVHYGLYALKHTHNKGLNFHNLRVPKENLLQPKRGDGLTIAYHGLNKGRVVVCALAAGAMRRMLASILPWAKYRKTYGESIDQRELVRRRIGRLAGLIVGADALVHWCAGLLDQGFRGEIECIVAKIFGSEAQKESAVELFMKTHGGRSFVHGHLLGDNIHEFLAPLIYEGEGDMLRMALFKSLVKKHGQTYFEPLAKQLAPIKPDEFQPWNPAHLWKVRQPLSHYAKWLLQRQFLGGGDLSSAQLKDMPKNLIPLAKRAAKNLRASALELSAVMRTHQLALADRQLRMVESSSKIQAMIVALVTCLYAKTVEDSLTHQAAEILADDLMRPYLGKRPSDSYFRKITTLGAQIADGGFQALTGIDADDILMPYDQSTNT